MDYWYAIIGGVLIVLPSLVDEDMKSKWKIVLVVAAITYTGVGMYLTHRAKTMEAADRREHTEEIKALRGDMTKMITLSSGTLPLMESLNSEVAILQREAEAAKETHDPRALADLQARANTAQQVSKGVSNRLLVAMVPNAAEQLRVRNGSDWNSAEGKEIIANADYLRQVMIRFVSQPTSEDREMTQVFQRAVAGNFRNWNPLAGANYLEALRKRLIPGPPTGVTVTVVP
ncbi:MAG: hypothetical protein ACRD20_18255 [Terriglobales bacterium]